MADPIQANERQWASAHDWARANRDLASYILELRDRVAALEAMARTTALVVPAAKPVPAGVTVLELAEILHQAGGAHDYGVLAARLLNHPRIGPLLRGEGAPAPKRVVLPETPTKSVWNIPYVGRTVHSVALDVWSAARAEVERQQGEQLPQTQEKSNDY